jgi:hypothetical protein
MAGDSGEYSKGGSQIHRYAAPEPGWKAPADSVSLERVQKHLEPFLGRAETVFHEIVSDIVHIDVHLFSPTERRPAHTLVTTGMSDRAMTAPPGREEYAHAELMVTLPLDWQLSEQAFQDERWYWPVRWLKQLARFPHQYKTWLAQGHTIPNGDPASPLGPGTKMTGILLMPPISMPVASYVLDDGASPKIHFYALYPLYDEEMNFKLAEGVDAVIDKMEAANLMDVVNPVRQSMVPRKKFLGLF